MRFECSALGPSPRSSPAGRAGRASVAALSLLIGSRAARADGPPPGAIGLAGVPTIVARSEADLLRAAQSSARGDVNVVIDRRIDVSRSLYFPPSTSVVRLIGVTPEAGIRFLMVFEGDPRTAAVKPANGIELNCRQAVVSGLTLSNFDWPGAVVKGEVKELLEVRRCRFSDIARRRYPPKVDPPRNASDTIYSQCIAAHNVAGGHIAVEQCEFERCAWSQLWSHCIYVSGRSVSIAGNRFSECGAALRLAGAPVEGSTVLVVDNVFEKPHTVPDRKRQREDRPPYLCDLQRGFSLCFMHNKVSGMYRDCFTGFPNARRQLIDHNDYSEMVFRGGWASDNAAGLLIDWRGWQQMGFDKNSKPPRAAGRE